MGFYTVREDRTIKNITRLLYHILSALYSVFFILKNKEECGMPKAKKTKSGSWKVRVRDHEEIVYDENGKPVRRPDGKVKKKQFFK